MSANTYSCGGDGSRFRGGVLSFLGFAVFGVTLLKNLRMPSFFSNFRSVSSSEGTDESMEERSEESDIVVVADVLGEILF